MGSTGDDSTGVGCFGCSADNRRGLGLEFAKQEDLVQAETTLGDDFAGYDGLAHGGIVSTLLDEAMGWAILELAGRFAVTRSLSIDFRRPVLLHRRLKIQARVAGEDPDGALRVEAGILDHRDRLLARGVGVWVPVRDSRVRPDSDKRRRV